jgi:hypothetical protein
MQCGQNVQFLNVKSVSASSDQEALKDPNRTRTDPVCVFITAKHICFEVGFYLQVFFFLKIDLLLWNVQMFTRICH